MSHADGLFDKYFIEFASYVIKDRAIPHLLDGFKPVQRRIIHTLLESDDGRFHKVAGVVGAVMKYHPHGDQSINDALVNLANCDLFIDKQGNYGNQITGDPAAAGRYIECRLLPLAKKVLYSPELTEYIDSYDGRNKEPVVFPAKIPVVVIQGTTGIAVGMKTDILPHNLLEVLDAQINALKGEDIILYPDFSTGGICDVSNYDDGKGSVVIRAKLDVSDPKKIVITELPYGLSTDKMIESIEDANKKGKLHIASIFDYSSDKANIEITLQRNTYTKDIVDALYAYTKCEYKISVNSLIIDDDMPRIMGISEIVKFHAFHLVEILTKELEIEKNHLVDKKHARTLERIFIEERIYKAIENKKTAEAVNKAVYKGFENFHDELVRPLVDEDIERLLKIPIRRISLFDIEKNRAELTELDNLINQCDENLANIVAYSIAYLEDVKSSIDQNMYERKTEITTFEQIDIKQVTVRNFDLKFDKDTGYIGTNVKTGETLLKVSPFDKVIYIKKNGTYRVINVSEREYIGTDALLYCTYADKDVLSKVIFTAIYKEKSSLIYFIKRFNITAFMNGKLYSFLPNERYKLVRLVTFNHAIIKATYKEGLGYRCLEETFRLADFRISKSPQAGGRQIITKTLKSLTLKETTETITSEECEPTLFDGEE